MRIELLTYTVCDGRMSISDDELVQLYYQMVADGTIEQMNYEGALPHSRAFLAAVRAANYFAIVSAGGQQVAVVWLNRYEHRRAHLHFCLFSGAWGAGSVEIGTEVMRRLIRLQANGTPLIDVIWGVIPTSNSRAAAYVQKCGGNLCAEIPNYVWNARAGKSEPGRLFYYVRSE